MSASWAEPTICMLFWPMATICANALVPDWTMARIRARSSHIGAVWLSRLTGFRLPLVSCALNPSDSGFAVPSISGLFGGLPGVCTNL